MGSLLDTISYQVIMCLVSFCINFSCRIRFWCLNLRILTYLVFFKKKFWWVINFITCAQDNAFDLPLSSDHTHQAIDRGLIKQWPDIHLSLFPTHPLNCFTTVFFESLHRHCFSHNILPFFPLKLKHLDWERKKGGCACIIGRIGLDYRHSGDGWIIWKAKNIKK